MSIRSAILAGLALLLASSAGVGVGWSARRAATRVRPPPRPHRPPALELALTAWARGDTGRLRSALPGLSALGTTDPVVAAEVEFLGSVAAGDRAGMGRVAAANGDRPAGARARWWLVEQAAPGARRDAMHDAFARAYPDAWVLGRRRAGGPGGGR